MSYQKALSLLGKGRANPSDYMVILPTKITGFSPLNDFREYVTYFTRAITLPGVSNSATALTGQENIGIQRNVITGRGYGSPLVMTITDRSDLIAYTTMKRWLDSSVINSDQRGSRSLRSNFYDNIKCDIDVLKLEAKRNTSNPMDDYSRGHMPTGQWSFINCIPLSIEQATLAVESADSLLDFTIAIAFESFTYTPLSNGIFGKSLDISEQLRSGDISPLSNRR